MSVAFYQETTGDFMVIYIEKVNGSGYYDGRAADIVGNPQSICGTTIHRNYLHKCRPVNQDNIPKEYLTRLT